MRSFITIDETSFPIVIGKYSAFIPTEEEFLNSQVDIEEYCRSHSDFVIIIDFSEMPILSSEYRVASAKWVKQNNSLFARQKMRIVFYVPSILIKIATKGVLLLTSPGVPYTLATTIDKAYDWASTQLKRK